MSPVAFPQEFSPALLDRFVCLGHVDRLCETHLASKRFFEGKKLVVGSEFKKAPKESTAQADVMVKYFFNFKPNNFQKFWAHLSHF